MILARKIYQAWQLARDTGIDLFDRGVTEKLANMPGWAALGLPSPDDAINKPRILEAIRAVDLLQRDVPPGQGTARLVATLPHPAFGIESTRSTAQILVQAARKELLVVGYSITDTLFCDLLIRRGQAGVSVTMVSDRGQSGLRDLIKIWPASAAPLIGLQGVEPVEGNSLIHGKVIVSDRNQALIGSANFTSGGFRNNLEIGLHVEGDVAGRVCDLIDQLRRERWLEPIPR